MGRLPQQAVQHGGASWVHCLGNLALALRSVPRPCDKSLMWAKEKQDWESICQQQMLREGSLLLLSFPELTRVSARKCPTLSSPVAGSILQMRRAGKPRPDTRAAQLPLSCWSPRGRADVRPQNHGAFCSPQSQ